MHVRGVVWLPVIAEVALNRLALSIRCAGNLIRPRLWLYSLAEELLPPPTAQAGGWAVVTPRGLPGTRTSHDELVPRTLPRSASRPLPWNRLRPVIQPSNGFSAR